MQVDEVAADGDAVNATIGRVDPAGFYDPKGGDWQAAASRFDEDSGSPP